MKNKLLLTLVLLCLIFTSSCDLNFGNNKKEVDVEEKLESVVELENYELFINYDQVKDDSQPGFNINVQFDNNKKLITISDEELIINFYYVSRTDEPDSEDYLIFKPSDFDFYSSYDGYVKLTENEMEELFGPTTGIMETMGQLNRIVTFFSSPNNDHFDVDTNSTFVLNQTGKDAFNELYNDIANEEGDVNEYNVECNYVVTTNNDYVTNMDIELSNDVYPDEIISIKVSFAKFNKIVLEIPTNTISFEEYEQLEMPSGPGATIG